MNNSNILGRIVKDPTLTFTPGKGTAVCKFTVAVNRPFEKGKADFINCVAFGKPGETISQYFQKGSQIAISGRIQTGSYDAQDGTKRYTTDLVVEKFDFVDSNKVSSNQDYSGTPFNDDITPVSDDSMPFN